MQPQTVSPDGAVSLTDVVQAFEQAAWRGEPRVADYLRGEGPARRRLLVELVHSALELGIRAGRPRRLAEFLAEHPELSDDPDDLAGLVETEVRGRVRAGERPDPGEYEATYPALGGRVREAFRRAQTVPDIPGYEVLAELGRGGMGVVYKARHLKLGRVVALKMVLTGGYASEGELLRFLDEARSAAALLHPGIVQVYEVGQHDGLPYFTLEFVPGGSLADRLGGQPQPVVDCARVVETLARAMDYAHGQGVVHRDLKPANVLLAGAPARGAGAPRHGPTAAAVKGATTIDGRAAAEDGGSAAWEPKITDFGLAKREGGAGLTGSGDIVGTAEYMAPEQASGKSKAVGPAADVYALGAILYEMLTGRPPFRAANPVDTLIQVIHDEPVPVRLLQPSVPVDLETVALKCLQKSPTRRYASAGALADDLRAYLEGRPIAARPVGRAERAWRWCRRNPVVAALLLAVSLASVGMGAFAVVARTESDKAKKALEDVEEQLAQGLIRPLGSGEIAGALNAAEHDALQETASLPPERDRVRRLLFRRTVEMATSGGRLGGRLEEVLTAAVGLRNDLRRECQQVIDPELLNGQAPDEARLVMIRLAELLQPDDLVLVNRAALTVVDLAEKATDPGQLEPLMGAYAALAGRLDAQQAGTGAATLASRLLDLAPKLTILTALPATPPQVTTANRSRRLARALVALAGRLDGEQAATLATRILDLATKATETSDPEVLEAFWGAYAALAGRLDAQQAATLATRILDLATKATNFIQLAPLPRAYAALAGRLDAKQAGTGAATLTSRLLDLATKPVAVIQWSLIPVELVGMLDAQQVATLVPRVLDLVSKQADTPYASFPLGKALEALAGRLDDTQAVTLATRVLDLATKANNPEQLVALAGAYAALAGRLDAKQAGTGAATLASRLLDLDTLPNPVLVVTLPEVWPALAVRLDAKQAATLAPRVLDLITKATNSPFNAVPLGKALVAVAGRLDAKEAATFATRVLDLATKTTHFIQLGPLADAYAVVAGRLDAKEAATLAPRVLDLATKATDPGQLEMLAGVYAALAGRLDAQQAGTGAATFASRLLDSSQGGSSSGALVALAGRLDAKQAASLAPRVLNLATKATDFYQVEGPSTAFVALAGRLDTMQAQTGLSVLAPRLAVTLRGASEPDNRPINTLTTLASHLTAQRQIDLLKHPGSVGPARPALIRLIAKRHGYAGEDLWGLVAHLEAHAPHLDLASPLPKDTWFTLPQNAQQPPAPPPVNLRPE